MAEAWVDIGPLIHYPEARHGRPCIAGTGMSVRAVGALYSDGLTAEAIADGFPDIPRSHIYAALTFYLANRERIDRELDEEERLYERLAKEHPRKGSER